MGPSTSSSAPVPPVTAKTFGLLVAGLALVLLLVEFASDEVSIPSLYTVVFWISLLVGVELLPVSLGYKSEVTMAFPLLLAISLLYEPPVAMVIAGLGAFDVREFKREIPLWQAIFNRAHRMLATYCASALVATHGFGAFQLPVGPIRIAGAALAFVFVNLGSVALGVSLNRRVPFWTVVRSLVPKPALGFWVSQALLASLGAATAAAYLYVGPFVAAFLIPLLFARLGIVGARVRQELAERVHKQQAALMVATEQVFEERERERKRIAEQIHDSSLQLLAAASISVGNARDYIAAGQLEQARELLERTGEAIDEAISGLRGSLVDLRRSSVESGGLMETIRQYVDQVSTLWGTKVELEGTIHHEPPVPVALAAFQILQEALVNALKHARSDSIRVRIADKENMVHIVVEDDGTGFDPNAAIGPDHVGMRLMRERAALVGGRIELRTARGAGTRLEAVLPGGMGS